MFTLYMYSSSSLEKKVGSFLQAKNSEDSFGYSSLVRKRREKLFHSSSPVTSQKVSSDVFSCSLPFLLTHLVHRHCLISQLCVEEK